MQTKEMFAQNCTKTSDRTNDVYYVWLTTCDLNHLRSKKINSSNKNPHRNASVVNISPVYFWCSHTLPVSCYAIVRVWLLPSQSADCHCMKTSKPTEFTLGDLSRFSRLFPSRPRTFAPWACVYAHSLKGLTVA